MLASGGRLRVNGTKKEGHVKGVIPESGRGGAGAEARGPSEDMTGHFLGATGRPAGAYSNGGAHVLFTENTDAKSFRGEQRRYEGEEG